MRDIGSHNEFQGCGGGVQEHTGRGRLDEVHTVELEPPPPYPSPPVTRVMDDAHPPARLTDRLIDWFVDSIVEDRAARPPVRLTTLRVDYAAPRHATPCTSLATP